jgi:hypothetical protein
MNVMCRVILMVAAVAMLAISMPVHVQDGWPHRIIGQEVVCI